MHELIAYSDPRLKHACASVHEIDQSIKDAVTDLIEVTKRVDEPWNFWLGMAAPQIGFAKSIFILRKSYGHYEVFINPKIVSRKFKTPAVSKCYSIRGVYFPMRYWLTKISYQNLEGVEMTQQFVGGKSWVVQHEIDHLNGVLASDYVGISF